jgi:copper transport protein
VQRVRHACLGLPAAAVFLVALAAAPAASGHAVVTDTSPPRRASLDRAPTEVLMTFNEPVQARAGDLRVYDSSGERVDDGKVEQPHQKQAEVRLRGGLDKDLYTATYRVISADGHPVSGGFTFGYGRTATGHSHGPSVAELLDEEKSTSVDVVYGIARGLAYLALLLSLGAAGFLLFVVPRGGDAHRVVQRVLLATAVVGGICSVLAVGLQGSLAAGAPLDRAFTRASLEVSLDNRVGLAWVGRGMMFGAIFLLALLARRFPRVLVLVGLPALAIALSLPLAGHARTQDPSAVLIPADTLHVVAASTWLGGLALLLLVFWPRRSSTPDATAWDATRRFSRLALPAMAVLVAGGTLQAVLYLSSPGDLVSEDYGLLLSAKILLLLTIVGLASRNRKAVAAARPDGPASRLRRAMRTEVALAVAVIAATAILVRTAPPEAAVAGPATPEIDLGPMRLEMSIEPARVGVNAAHLYFYDRRTGDQVDGIEELTLELTQPDKGIAPIQVRIPRKSFAHYELQGLTFPVKGTWKLRVFARVGKFDQYDGRTEIDVN